MKALTKAQAAPGLWLTDVPEPAVGPNDVLIRVLKTSICGTDVHIWNWDDWARRNIPVGLVIGHEFVGQVAGWGSNVQGFKQGDLVCGEGHVVCGRCRNCLAGRRHLCAHTLGVGVNRDGAYAEFIAIPAGNVWPADKRIPTDILSSFDPLGNATHTALTYDLLGEDVLITGAGPIGIMATAIARHAGARNIVITDVNPYRLEIACRMGATLAVNVAERPVDQALQRELGMTEGFDVGMEMSGNATAFRMMLSNMGHGGKIALLGILPKAEIDWDVVVFGGLSLRGIYGRQMFETWYKMTMMIQCGLDISPVITHRFHHTEFEKAFEVMRTGNSGKVVMEWSEPV